MKVVFSKKCLEYKVSGHPESPERVLNVFNFLKEKEFKFIEAKPCEENDLLEVHASEYVERIKSCIFLMKTLQLCLTFMIMQGFLQEPQYKRWKFQLKVKKPFL